MFPDETNESLESIGQTTTPLQAIAKSDAEVLASALLSFGFIKYKIILTRIEVIYERTVGFASTTLKSIDINEITNVTGSVGPFFGIIDFTHTSQEFPQRVGMFWRDDAIRMKRIIKGYVIASKQGANYSTIPAEKLVPMLQELGTADSSITR
jgi:hypothetical protein